MRRLRTLALACSLAWAPLACSGGADGDADSESATARDTLTRDQKDSLLGTMPVPGAGAVGRARDAARDAGTRAEAHDTMR